MRSKYSHLPEGFIALQALDKGHLRMPRPILLYLRNSSFIKSSVSEHMSTYFKSTQRLNIEISNHEIWGMSLNSPITLYQSHMSISGMNAIMIFARLLYQARLLERKLPGLPASLPATSCLLWLYPCRSSNLPSPGQIKILPTKIWMVSAKIRTKHRSYPKNRLWKI